MQTLNRELTSLVREAFVKAGFGDQYGAVKVSDRPDLADYQCNDAMAIAKAERRNPFDIATAVCEQLQGCPAFDSVSVARPGFINMKISGKYLADRMNGMRSDSDLGFVPCDNPCTIVIDYGGPNVAKPLHVGHLRSAIIGETMKRLARSLGNNVIGDVHLGDWGLQMGLVITEIRRRWPDLVYFRPDFDESMDDVLPISAEDLYNLYPFASQKAKEDAEYMAEAQEATLQLQNHHPGYYALWRNFMQISVNDLKANYAALSVDFDVWYGESDCDKYVNDMVQGFIDGGYAYESEGALVVDVADESDNAPMPPCLIRKSNGAILYATTDLATIVQRVRDFHPDKIWYLTDARQTLHFDQVFRCAKKTGIAPADMQFEYLPFGTMNGKDGKPFKTREGGVMRLSDLINMMHDAFAEKCRRSSTIDSDEAAAESEALEGLSADESETARLVGNAALKFGDMVNHRTKNYVFDLDKFMSFNGKTGPYLLYTVVRIQSVLRKAAERGLASGPIVAPAGDTERALMMELARSSAMKLAAFDEKAPNYICESLYNTASAFNKFYYENRILDEADDATRGSWLTLLTLIRDVMKHQLWILGIDVPEKM